MLAGEAQNDQIKTIRGNFMNVLNYSASDEFRLWSKIDLPEDLTKCWIWKGSYDSDTYGLFWLKGKTERAHRIIWGYYNGTIPSNQFVCHDCDTPSCVNINHLFLGTNSENTQDKVIKNRQSKGSNHSMASTTETELDDLFQRVLLGEIINYDQILREYGISDYKIQQIINGGGWKHIGSKYPMDKIKNILDGSHRRRILLTNTQVNEIRTYFKYGKNRREISKIYNIGYQQVAGILNGTYYYSVPFQEIQIPLVNI